MMLVVAYFAQWQPWALSPRIDFLYNFYPNLAVICLCSTFVMITMWRQTKAQGSGWIAQVGSGVYLAACIGLFVYFLPIWNGAPISWAAWYQRMWIPSGAPIGWI
jgi:dolichyl-phosphate-mannose--protein O-mannosyl transferase